MKTRMTISVEEHLAKKIAELAERSDLSSSAVVNTCLRYALPKLEQGNLLNPFPATRSRTPVSLLLVEDSDTDAELLITALRRADYDPKVEMVQTAKEMEKALQVGGWDFILSDWVLPEFSGLEALGMHKKFGAKTPFIIVSGRIGEEAVVEAIRAGADDHVLKDRLESLAHVMDRVLGRRAKSSSIPSKPLLFRSVAVFLAAFFLFLEVEAVTTAVAPTTLYTDRGVHSPQSVSVLSTQEESGQSDGRNNYIEFYGAPVGYEGRFLFPVPASLSEASSSSSIQLSVQFRGPSVGGQRWRFEIFDHSAGIYLLLGDNANAQSWVWSRLNFSIPAGNPLRFFRNGEVQIRFVTDSSVDDCDLDYIALVFDDFAAPAPAPAVSFGEITTDFPNPERGFFRFSDLLPTTDFASIRASGASLAYTRVQLNNYRTSPISQAFLDDLSLAFTKLRAAGLKTVLRFQYDEAGGQDASLDQILAHIEQLKPILRQNSHLIATLQAGFIGAWAEWHSSVNGHDQNTAAKSAILLALLDAVPDRYVQIRTPTHKADIFGSNFPMTDSAAFSSVRYARVGHLNDAFLGSDTDLGTYPWNAVDQWRSRIASETRFVPMGGEVLYNPPRSSSANALAEMALLHFSFLNQDYQQQVMDSWQQDGTYQEIRRRLGYRFVLRTASVASSVQRGQNLPLNLHIENVGFAAMYNPRPIWLVLSNGLNRYEISLTGKTFDPRRWLPGATLSLDAQVPIPATMAPGTYQLSLWLPDPHPDLRRDVRYAVRFANQGTWNAISGENALGASTIINAAPVQPPGLQVVREQGVVALRLTGNPGETCIIEASDNLPDWMVIGAHTLTGNLGTFVDPAQQQYPKRLYRVRR